MDIGKNEDATIVWVHVQAQTLDLFVATNFGYPRKTAKDLKTLHMDPVLSDNESSHFLGQMIPWLLKKSILRGSICAKNDEAMGVGG